jgi:N6-adenosine-specific RNA methylase IME4
VEYVQVGTAQGLWVRRAHEVAYVGTDGVPLPETVRLAAQTLLVDRTLVTVRLEGARTLDEAVTIAETLR